MTPEQKVTSRELSEKLRDAGAKQESEKDWCNGTLCDEWGSGCRDCMKYNQGQPCSAFTCAELLEGLPYQMVWNDAGEKVSQRLRSTWRGDGVTVGYRGLCQAFDEQFVEALGKLELWCLENGHIKEGRV